MIRQQVKSSNLESVGYDAAEQLLEVEFKGSGNVYQYEGVPPNKHAEMMAAESIGSYFSKNIRGTYEGKKVEAASEAKQ